MLEWYERVWKNADESAIEDLLHPDCIIHGIGVPIKGPEEFLAFHRTFLTNYRNPSVEVFEMVESEDTSLGHATFLATHAPSGEPISFVFSFSVKWRHGQAIEGRNVVDFTGLLAQLGALDPAILAETLAPSESATA